MGAVAVLGAGAWGTALAVAILRAGGEVRLWGRDPDSLAAMTANRENAARLPGVELPPELVIEPDLSVACRGAEVLVLAVPAQALRNLAQRIRPHCSAGAAVVLAAKGIERDTGRFPTEILAEEVPGRPAAILSGPSFAADVGRGLPTAVTLAAPALADAAALGARLGSASLRLYHSDDVRGVEIGGAAKNVLAIACGIAAGRELGASAVAALTARAFAELGRFGRSLGGREETLAGLSGLGDLVLTCTSPQSRNFSHGVALCRGRPMLARGVVEGVWTAPVLARLAASHGIDMPICDAVAAVVGGSLTVDEAIERLTRRPFRAET